MRTYASTVVAVLLVALWAVEGQAAVPLLMPTQGVLRDNAGQPVGGESFEMTFAIYAQATEGDPVWTETWPPGGADCVAEPAGCVPVEGGVFSLMLGTHAALDPTLFRAHSALWLGVSVEGEPELPRRPLASAAFAMHAQSAEVASGVDCVGCIGTAALSPEVVLAIESSTPGPDSLDEVSNGTLTNEFERSYAATGLPSSLGLSVNAQIAVEQAGTVRDVSVSVTLDHPFTPDLEVRLLRPGDPVGIQLVAAGELTDPEVTVSFDTESVLPGGESLSSLVGTGQGGVWIVRVSDTVQNGNEGQGSVSQASLTLRYLASAEVGIKMPDGSVQLVGPEQNDTLTTLSQQVASLQAEMWCLKQCDVDKISDCLDRDCDGTAESCVPSGTLEDGTTCLGGVGVCIDGTCCIPGTCPTLGAECGSIDDSCGGVLACGACGAGYECNDNTCEAYGTSAAVPAASCDQLETLGLDTEGDGLYWVSLNGLPVQVHCNMTIAGGGWTLVMQVSPGVDGTFGYQSDYWTSSAVLNETPPTVLTQINAKYATFNHHVSSTGRVLLVDKETGLHSELEIPGLTSNTLQDRFATLPKTNLTVVSGQGSPQELMGYGGPTAMCQGPPSKWMINMLASHAGVRLGNDVATNDQTTNASSSWHCYAGEGMNLAYSGVGGTLENTRVWQDGYGSETLNRWRDNGGTGQGSHNGLAIYVK